MEKKIRKGILLLALTITIFGASSYISGEDMDCNELASYFSSCKDGARGCSGDIILFGACWMECHDPKGGGWKTIQCGFVSN